MSLCLYVYLFLVAVKLTEQSMPGKILDKKILNQRIFIFYQKMKVKIKVSKILCCSPSFSLSPCFVHTQLTHTKLYREIFPEVICHVLLQSHNIGQKTRFLVRAQTRNTILFPFFKKSHLFTSLPVIRNKSRRKKKLCIGFDTIACAHTHTTQDTIIWLQRWFHSSGSKLSNIKKWKLTVNAEQSSLFLSTPPRKKIWLTD